MTDWVMQSTADRNLDHRDGIVGGELSTRTRDLSQTEDETACTSRIGDYDTVQ